MIKFYSKFISTIRIVMNWTFENFKPKLENLTPEVREKALDIAREMMEKGGISEEKAIKEAIIRAEEWFYDCEG
ncbi:hypothetical protein [Aequorivita aquimaris]|uniref:hypothetical protein n=1 Tax=Aequorivita aquimaris TaxID=1548749 RepID=UPI0010420504|nr:hypothetical protein [Aequorivita aquimaris]